MNTKKRHNTGAEYIYLQQTEVSGLLAWLGGQQTRIGQTNKQIIAQAKKGKTPRSKFENRNTGGRLFTLLSRVCILFLSSENHSLSSCGRNGDTTCNHLPNLPLHTNIKIATLYSIIFWWFCNTLMYV